MATMNDWQKQRKPAHTVPGQSPLSTHRSSDNKVRQTDRQTDRANNRLQNLTITTDQNLIRRTYLYKNLQKYTITTDQVSSEEHIYKNKSAKWHCGHNTQIFLKKK